MLVNVMLIKNMYFTKISVHFYALLTLEINLLSVITCLQFIQLQSAEVVQL